MVVDMGYWSKVFRRLLIFVTTVVGIYLAFRLAIFYVPFLIAFIIYLLIEPLIRLLMKKAKLNRKLSCIIVLFTISVVIIGLLTWGITSVISESSNLLKDLNGYFEKAYTQIKGIIDSINFEKIQISGDITKMIQDSIFDVLGSIATWAKNFLTSIMNGVSYLPTVGVYLAVTFIAIYFICTDKIYMIDQLEHHVPKDWVKRLGRHIKQLTTTLGAYLKAEVILVFISFIISIVGLYIIKIIGLKVEYPLLAALGIAFVDLLPILGSGTVMIPWAILSAINGDLNLGIAILVLWSIMSIVRQFMEPKIISKKIGIHPIFTLIAMYTGFRFIGIIGMLVGPIILIILKNVFATLIEQGILKTIFDKK